MHCSLSIPVRKGGASLRDVAAAVASKGGGIALNGREGQLLLSFSSAPLLELSGDVLQELRAGIQAKSRVPGHPFSGGLMGYVSYEAGRHFEPMPASKGPLLLPEWGLRRYEGGILHDGKKWWIAGAPDFVEEAAELIGEAKGHSDGQEECDGSWATDETRDAFLQAVEDSLKRIAAGDCYQVNVSRRLELDWSGSGVEAFWRLQERFPARFGAWIQTEGGFVVGNSPELFLEVCGDKVLTAPIKGTRPRLDGGDSEACRLELEHSIKEKAELTMIVDMARNDLSKVCRPGSVEAGPREILDLPTLFHAEQKVWGQLSSHKDAVDAFAAAFPPASVTGAPKVKAMELIGDLEPVPRGVYTGAIGFFADGGDAVFSVGIRTLSVHQGVGHLHVGCGIVADSVPSMELDESKWKAAAIARTLGTETEWAGLKGVGR